MPQAIALLVAVQTVGAARLETMVYFMCSGCPDGMYGTHLHADTCANNGGGVSQSSSLCNLFSAPPCQPLQCSVEELGEYRSRGWGGLV